MALKSITKEFPGFDSIFTFKCPGAVYHFHADIHLECNRLDQSWGNTAVRIVKARIPAGTIIYEGATASPRGLVGDGNQIYIPKVNQELIIP